VKCNGKAAKKKGAKFGGFSKLGQKKGRRGGAKKNWGWKKKKGGENQKRLKKTKDGGQKKRQAPHCREKEFLFRQNTGRGGEKKW